MTSVRRDLEPEDKSYSDLLQSHYSLCCKIEEWKALVGTIRGLIGCPVRNVDDLTPEQHSHEIMEYIEKYSRRSSGSDAPK